MSRSAKALLVALVLVASACTTATDTTTTTTESTTTAAPEPTSTVGETVTTEAPSSNTEWSIEEHLAWFLAVLNGAEVTADEYEARFAQIFKDQVAFSDFTPLIGQITGGLTGWSVVDTESSGATNLVTLISPSAGEPVLRLLLIIDADQRIDVLFLQPGEPPALDDPPESFDEAFERLAAL